VGATAVCGLIFVSAIARRIAGPYSRRSLTSQMVAGHLAGADSPALEELRDEVAQLRSEVAELRDRSAELEDLQNRLDFAERMLAHQNDRPRQARTDG